MIKAKKSTAELLSELRATGYIPYVDRYKDAETVATVEDNTIRAVGQLNTMKLAKYLVRQ